MVRKGIVKINEDELGVTNRLTPISRSQPLYCQVS